MTAKEAMVEVFWKAYMNLPKKLREALITRIISSESLSEDKIDHILIEKSRQEKGRDITLNEYIKN